MSEVALDTSAAVPYVVRSHTAHSVVRRHIGTRRACLTGHSLAETYSVLTRLPGDARVGPADAVTLLERNFDPACVLDGAAARTLHAELAPLGIAGGAVYDALVGLAARGAGIALATRDRRAEGTYTALGVQVDLIVG